MSPKPTPSKSKGNAPTRKRVRTFKPVSEQLSAECLLRSINVVFDVAEPARVAHFRPTSKCVVLLRALLGFHGEASFVVVAPYGSGKSLASTYAAQVIENCGTGSETLRGVGNRVTQVSPELSAKLVSRRKSERSGLAITLSGPTDNLPESIRAALIGSLRRTKRAKAVKAIESETWRSIEDFFAAVTKLAGSDGAPDKILFVWDEFGRHLESLVASGRASELNDLQTLAEFAARQKPMKFTIGLLMHQPMVQYAGSAPQGVRNEWAKIAGRFETIEFIDDSVETYRLLGEAMDAKRGSSPVVGKSFLKISKAAKELDLFSGVSTTALKDICESAAPMHPTALWLLPRVSARVAQNERTLFTFLGSINANRPIGLAEIYDYFAPVMRGDTAIGGSYRQYLEAESAIAKCADIEYGAYAVKSACLLGLGLSGARSRASRALVEFALSAYCDDEQARATVTELLQRKILLHRKHSDELSVWHGTDADLRGRLEAEMQRRIEALDIVAALNAELPPPFWKPVRYNDQYKTARFYRSEYRRVTEATRGNGETADEIALFADGRVVYLLAESEDDRAVGKALACSLTEQQSNLIVALSVKPLRLTPSLKEIEAIHALQCDKELIGSDPLIASELQQMLEDSRSHIQRVMDTVVKPDGRSTDWFAKGKIVKLNGVAGLRELMSTQMETLYELSPRVANELIVREKPSAVMVNARKKLVLAILERTGLAELGILGRSADHSLFRCVLLNTGLYRSQANDEGCTWRFADVKELKDRGLREVWGACKKFVSTPSVESKSLRQFFAELRAAPYGVRSGLIPILFAAALKAFPAPITLSRRGEYVGDILPSVVEDLCKNPDEFRFTVLDLGATECEYLRQVHTLFSGTEGTSPTDGDLVRLAFESVEAWKRQLAPASLKTYRIAPSTKKLRDAINLPSDALVLLLTAMPRAVGCSDNLDRAPAALSRAKSELEEVPSRFEAAASEAIRRSLGVSDIADRGLRGVCDIWFAAIPKSIREKLKANRDDPRPGALLERMAIRYEGDDQLLHSLCSLVTDVRPSRWEDVTPAIFARTFDDTVRRIEAAAIDAAVEASLEPEECIAMARLGQGRLRAVLGMLTTVIGKAEAVRLANETVRELGNAPRK